MRILAISGSLRAHSVNTAVLAAAALIAPPPMQVALYRGLGSLPLFNPDLDTETPPLPVAALKQEIGASDGLLICSPEYARGVAGAMKNALDWLVSSTEFPGKPVAVINASQRATHADGQLRLTLATMSARLVEEASITLPLLGRELDAVAIAADSALSAQPSPLSRAWRARSRKANQFRVGSGGAVPSPSPTRRAITSAIPLPRSLGGSDAAKPA